MKYKFYNEKGNILITWSVTPPQEVFDIYTNYIMAEEFQKPEQKEGFYAEEYIDIETKELKYRYIEIQQSPEDIQVQFNIDIDYRLSKLELGI